MEHSKDTMADPLTAVHLQQPEPPVEEGSQLASNSITAAAVPPPLVTAAIALLLAAVVARLTLSCGSYGEWKSP